MQHLLRNGGRRVFYVTKFRKDKQTMDPNVLLSFLWKVLQYGGAAVAAFGLFLTIKGWRGRDPEDREQGMWTMLAGGAAFLIGMWMSGFSFPTI